ncbi:MAG: hypothetical protein JSU05_15365, partial [Bacteroidetes bacterium]|nr:hypothetical protein [Bacteroidota bacterium]
MRKLLLLAGLLTFVFANAQKKQKTNTAPAATTDSVFFSTMHYRLVGPFRGGRSGAVAGSYKNK